MLGGVRVLAVDDDRNIREVLILLAGNYGARVMGTESAPSALVTFVRFRPDVVVSGISLPEQNAFWLLGESGQERPGLK
jgi:two-component system OmpR family response regulator